MTEEGLEIFSIVAECGSNTEAAKILRMSQSSVSRALSRLEAKYNTKLLNRDSYPFTLTKNGIFLKDRIDRGLSVSQQLSRFIEEQNIKQLKIGYSFPVSLQLISESICRLKRYEPDIRICLDQVDRFSIHSKLSEGLLDIAVLPERLYLSEYRIIHSISDYDWGIAVPSGIPLTSGNYIEPDDIAGFPLTVPADSVCTEAIFEWCGNRINLRYADTYNDLDTCIRLINLSRSKCT